MSGRSIIVIGGGSLALEIIPIIRQAGDSVAAIAVEHEYLHLPHQLPPMTPIVSLEDIRSDTYRNCHAVVAVGYSSINQSRDRLLLQLDAWNVPAALAIHSSATISDDAAVQAGCILLERVVVQRGVSIDPGVVVWAGSTVCHDSSIGRCAFVGPGATICGHVTIEDRAFVGAGSVIRDGVHIGEEAIIGAGSIVMHDVPAKSVYKPARGSVVTDVDTSALL